MYKVFINDANVVVNGVLVASVPAVESALAFALDLHRASNVPHCVRVIAPTDVLVVELNRLPEEPTNAK